MRKGRTFLSTLAVAAVLALPVQAQDTAPTPDVVIASVNGTEITLAHVMLAMATLPQQYQQLPADTLYDAVVDQLVQQEALRQSNVRMPGYVQLQLQNEERSLLAGHAIEQVMANAATDEDIKAVYDAEYTDTGGEMEYNASHILVETEEEALAIIEDLKAGADFAQTAAEKSTGPSGPNGGSLGWFGKGMMVPAFEVAVIALGPNEVSAPVQTQFGWHVIILNDSRQLEAPAFEDVYEEIATRLRREAVTAHVETLVSQAKVERSKPEGLDPEMLRNLDLLR